LFVANGSYPVETYAQIPIGAAARRGDTLIARGLPVPDLIWMDTQGAELLVLRGFGTRLGAVKLLKIELSLREIYTGQALADDVVRFLRNAGFRWHSVLHPGHWQFDGAFVRTEGWSLRLRVRDWLLTRSLMTTAKPGIAVGTYRIRALAREVAIVTGKEALARSNSRWVPFIAETCRRIV
jgi:hypothetical protein